MTPCRGGTSSSSDNPSSHSPFSHSGSTPEPVATRPTPLTVKVPTPKRRSLPARWIKESDVDDPSTLYLSPIDSPIEELMTAKKHMPPRSAHLSNAEHLPPNPKLGVAGCGAQEIRTTDGAKQQHQDLHTLDYLVTTVAAVAECCLVWT
ncbi:unnamed protein product [Nippostrongylus brasiliensis]|uniref:CARMIL_C domain-containing protein n=1 Tax=Nippostrongylus brasiliensis TaxID=27835 RepID=A0A0N4YW44_NIPBR|nr:unnamed protein product [Nippostrongylus brasiliensis]